MLLTVLFIILLSIIMSFFFSIVYGSYWATCPECQKKQAASNVWDHLQTSRDTTNTFTESDFDDDDDDYDDDDSVL